MKVNFLEKLFLNNFVWAFIQRRFIVPVWSKSVDLKSESVVLEAGCGRGAGSLIIFEEFHPSLIDAFDLDVDMIALAKEHIPKGYSEKINLFVGDVTNIPKADSSYDAVFDFFTLYHVEDWQLGLSEISRVIKSGGYFAFMEPYEKTMQNLIFRNLFDHPSENRFNREDWLKGLAENGLRIMESKSNIWGKGLIGVATKI